MQTRPQPGWRWLPAAVLGGSYAPILFWHAAELFKREHYQYVLFVPIGMLLLLLNGKSLQLPWSLPKLRWPAAIVLTLGMISLGLATWVWSPWLGMISFLISAFGLCLWLTGNLGLDSWLPAWIFGLTSVPLPFGYDQDLVLKLRNVTTRLTSVVLDELGILHRSYANVIEVPGKPLFIADACSGIHSLFVLLSAALFLGLYRRRGVIQTLILMVTTFGLVLVENIARLTAVVYFLRWRVDLSQGSGHVLLGGTLFILSLLLVLTTDQLIQFLSPTITWTWWIPWLRRTKPLVEPLPTTTGPIVGAPRFSFGVAMLLIFPMLGLAQLPRMPRTSPRIVQSLLGDDVTLPTLGKEGLPGDLRGYQIVSHDVIQRVIGDPLGLHSQQWLFRKQGRTVMVSLDYPYSGVHDLTVCYANVGWKTQSQRMCSAEVLKQENHQTDAPLAVSLLSHALDGFGMIAFSLMDEQGRSLATIKEMVRSVGVGRINDRLGSVRQPQPTLDPATTPQPPYVQFHLFCRSSTPLTEADQRDVLELFIEARQMLTEKITGRWNQK